MHTINANFSTSTNIQRDIEKKDIYYLPTNNTNEIYQTIKQQFVQTSQRSFSLIGAYGSGKSSFLWALEKTLNRKKTYFSEPSLAAQTALFEMPSNGFETLAIVGEAKSFIQSVAEAIGMNTEVEIKGSTLLKALNNYVETLHEQGKGLLILIDEFGKFLEYIAKNEEVEVEFYFVQQLSEFVNDKEKNILFITSLHQSVSSYFIDLTETQRKEWKKVEGRLTELAFNEPVEQLLFLLATHLGEANTHIANQGDFEELFHATKKAFPTLLRDYYTTEIVEKLYPIDIFAAAVLTLSLQKYGQNERSLFSFFSSNDYLGLQDCKGNFYNLVNVYDYLYHNFYIYLVAKENIHYLEWSRSLACMDRLENLLNQDKIPYEQFADACKLIKTITLANLFYPHAGTLNEDFLAVYGKIALQLQHTTSEILKMLVSYKISFYRKFTDRYVMFSGSDIDIEKELQKAKNEVSEQFDLLKSLEEHFNLSYTVAKQVSYQYGTTRIFAYRVSEFPTISFDIESEIDGYINLIFSSQLKAEKVQEISANCQHPILFGFYQNTQKITDLLLDVEAIRAVIRVNLDENEKVVVEELSVMQAHQINLLNQAVIDALYQNDKTIAWFYKGQAIVIDSYKHFNQTLSNICQDIYYHTPIFRNEMVNKAKLSSQIISARNEYLMHLTEKAHEPNLGFAENLFPPQKTIYYALLKETGIHTTQNEIGTLQAPTDISFLPLWQAGIEFLITTKTSRRSLNELVDILAKPPMKLKRGFVEFWLPTFLIINKNDFALFLKDGYVPMITNDILERIIKTPEDFEVKMFDVEGVKLDIFNSYRALMNKNYTELITANSFIETIRPFLSFYRNLDEYSKKTRRFSKHTLALREAIAYAKDPEKTFFEDFPQALGFNLLQLRENSEELENFAFQLQDAIREIRTAYSELINRIETFLNHTILQHLEVPQKITDLSFPENKEFLRSYFKGVKPHLLLPHHQVFYQRIVANLADRTSWIASLSQACISKPLNAFTDDEELRLYDKLKAILTELDGLRTLSKEQIQEGEEEIFEFSALSVNFKQKFRVSKQKIAENEKVVQKIQKLLTNDDKLNVAILSHLLAEILKK